MLEAAAGAKTKKSFHIWWNQHFHLRCVPSCGVLLSTAVNFSFIPVAKNNQSFSWNQRDRQKKTEGEHVRYNMCKWGIQFQWCHSLQTVYSKMLLHVCMCCMHVLHWSCICHLFFSFCKKKEYVYAPQTKFCVTLYLNNTLQEKNHHHFII